MDGIFQCIRAHGYQDVKEQVGKGTFGVAFIVCEKQQVKVPGILTLALAKSTKECKLVVKVVKILEENEDSINRELIIYQLLQNSSIAPRLDSAWKCDGAQYMALQRFSGDMLSLGNMQLAQNRATIQNAIIASSTRTDFEMLKKAAVHYTGGNNVLYTEPQLQTMFRLAKELWSNYRIIHGDLKPDNMFYDAKTGQIVVADFGFSGHYPSMPALVGWPWFMSKTCTSYDPIPDAADLADYNSWQLSSWLGAFVIVTFVKKNDGSFAVFRPNVKFGIQWYRDCNQKLNEKSSNVQTLSRRYINLPAYP